MKIAVVHSFYNAQSPSGENNTVVDQVAALRTAGHDVELISKYTPTDGGGLIYKLKSAGAAAGFSGADPTSLLTAFDPDIIHVHNLFPNWGQKWLGRWGPRTVTTLHNFRPLCAAATLWRDDHPCTECIDHGSHRAVKHNCYRDSKIATIPLAISSRNAGKHVRSVTQPRRLITLNTVAQKHYSHNFPDADVRLIPNFVELPHLPRKRERDGFVYAGRLTHEKGFARLLDEWPAGQRLDIYGTGPLEHLATAASSHRPGIAYHGNRPRPDVLAALANAHALILPSLWPEGIPTVAIEALAVGTPLIVSSLVASAPLLTSTECGVIFDADRPQAVADALKSALVHDAQVNDRARLLYEESYTSSVWLQHIGDVYDEVHSVG